MNEFSNNLDHKSPASFPAIVVPEPSFQIQPGVTAGPIKCGPNALPHNRGRWFFWRGDGDILWANGAEPFSDSQQGLFREAFESDMESGCEARGYHVRQSSPFDFLSRALLLLHHLCVA